jgi:basic amino acid/polyamine antiporter, APA family
MNNSAKIGWKTALGIVLSNMIGTGVFTSLGYQGGSKK